LRAFFIVPLIASETITGLEPESPWWSLLRSDEGGTAAPSPRDARLTPQDILPRKKEGLGISACSDILDSRYSRGRR